jgi:hypothetical protein
MVLLVAVMGILMEFAVALALVAPMSTRGDGCSKAVSG